jgi:hypothetical protein
MGIFVVVQATESQRQGGRLRIYELRQSTFTMGLVADYALVDWAAAEEVAEIKRYPRCTETGLTLFLRMLKNASKEVLCEPVVGDIAVSLRIAGDPLRPLEAEHLHLKAEDSSLLVHLLSPAALVAGMRVSVRPVPSVREAICEAMRSALGWGDLLPLPPIPLSDVPVRRSPLGREYVCLSDVPPLPRQYLRLHFCQSPEDQTIQAGRWHAFLSRCSYVPHQASGQTERDT